MYSFLFPNSVCPLVKFPQRSREESIYSLKSIGNSRTYPKWRRRRRKRRRKNRKRSRGRTKIRRIRGCGEMKRRRKRRKRNTYYYIGKNRYHDTT